MEKGTENLLVVDQKNNRVQKFDKTGKLLKVFGQLGSSKGDFNTPTDLTLDKNGNIYVADTGNNRIQKFDASGGYLGQWGSTGTGNGQFQSPQGLAVDKGGNLYVADSGNNTIRKITPVGTNWVVTTVAGKAGTAGSADGTNSAARFSNPLGMAVDIATMAYGTHFFIAGAMTLYLGKHIRTDFWYGKWSPKTQAWVDVICYVLLFLPGMVMFAWLSWDFFAESWDLKEKLMTTWRPWRNAAAASEKRLASLCCSPLLYSASADGCAGRGAAGTDIPLRVLQGVHEFPMRVKCATLPWHVLQAALEQQAASRQSMEERLGEKSKGIEAIKNDALFEVLERELAEGRKYYEKNIDPAVLAETDYFDRAVVDILVKGQGSVESKIW